MATKRSHRQTTTTVTPSTPNGNNTNNDVTNNDDNGNDNPTKQTKRHRTNPRATKHVAATNSDDSTSSDDDEKVETKEPKQPSTTVVTSSSSIVGKGTRTRVVALARRKGVVTQDCDIYIGRACNMGGWRLPQSIWYNPYSVKSCGGSAAKAVAKFEKYLQGNATLMARIGELKGKTLGCWCKKPNTPTAPCHGDILARLADAS